jgi:hypothetical protein
MRVQDLLGVPVDKRVRMVESNVAGKLKPKGQASDKLEFHEPGPRLWVCVCVCVCVYVCVCVRCTVNV